MKQALSARTHIVGVSGLFIVSVTVSAACTDLFHGTDFQTLCERELDNPQCLSDSGPDIPDTAGKADADAALPEGLCTEDKAAALATSRLVCARLGVKMGPLGNSAYGECLFQALRVYDCAVDRQHPPLGARKAYFECLKRAQSADDFSVCLYGTSLRACPTQTQSSTECGFDTIDPLEKDVPFTRLRYACSGTSPKAELAESCISAGQRCASVGTGLTVCAGIAGANCSANGCKGTHLQRCRGVSDIGRDCALEGGGACVQGPVSTEASCAPLASATTKPCSVSRIVTCAGGGVATTCPSGKEETLDCTRMGLSCGLPGATELADACTAMPGSACVPSCKGDVLLDCMHGAEVGFDCKAANMGTCELVSVGSSSLPRCTR